MSIGSSSITRRNNWLLVDVMGVAVSIVLGLYVSSRLSGIDFASKFTFFKFIAIFSIQIFSLIATSSMYQKTFRRWNSYHVDAIRIGIGSALAALILFILFVPIPHKTLETALSDAIWPSLLVMLVLLGIRAIEYAYMQKRYNGTTVLFIEIEQHWYDSLKEMRNALSDDWCLALVALKYMHSNPQLPDGIDIWDEAKLKEWVDQKEEKKDKYLIVMGESQPKTKLHESLIRKIYSAPIATTNIVDFYEEILEKMPMFEHITNWYSSMGLTKMRQTDRILKRIMDIAVSLPLLILFSPVMLVLAIMIRLESKGPVIFRHQRVGYQGKEFTFYKLRTMEVHEDDSLNISKDFKQPFQDHRVTKLGKKLRSLGLDELPQLYNVLKGDMSMIGPRPARRKVVERHEQRIPFYAVQNSVKPGISGWAQIHNGQDLDDASIFEKTRFNLYYAKYFSIWLDLLIYIRTFSSLILGEKPESLYLKETGPQVYSQNPTFEDLDQKANNLGKTA